MDILLEHRSPKSKGKEPSVKSGGHFESSAQPEQPLLCPLSLLPLPRLGLVPALLVSISVYIAGALLTMKLIS